ncbi:hypothetical protein B0T20DRAFT_215342 [Sordaria brevicollis]|uniref:Uncharacterized protein n=1 Tax=Sordaria brevicollis TaxID=83679 RepID=A0AAE0UC50_SORBR|nr:hypothetical protein B0T20DRAFT_215342 [Sordaria brevicollis]
MYPQRRKALQLVDILGSVPIKVLKPDGGEWRKLYWKDDNLPDSVANGIEQRTIPFWSSFFSVSLGVRRAPYCFCAHQHPGSCFSSKTSTPELHHIRASFLSKYWRKFNGCTLSCLQQTPQRFGNRRENNRNVKYHQFLARFLLTADSLFTTMADPGRTSSSSLTRSTHLLKKNILSRGSLGEMLKSPGLRNFALTLQTGKLYEDIRAWYLSVHLRLSERRPVQRHISLGLFPMRSEKVLGTSTPKRHGIAMKQEVLGSVYAVPRLTESLRPA